MPKILIPYKSSEGHTARIAAYIADLMRREGYEVHPVAITRSDTPAPDGYDGVVVGASVHMGRHQAGVRDYIRTHRAALERIPSAFFSVSLAAGDHNPQARDEAEGYVQELLRQTGWRPGKVERFAGALLYTKYNFVIRWIMKRIARAKGSPDTDTSRDYVYTDWGGVERFTREFLESAFPKTGDVASGVGR